VSAPSATSVSVVIPVFNRPRYLAEAVASVLATDYSNLEILIVDDGSSDETPEVAQRLAGAHPRTVRTLRHPDGGNHGPGASRNRGASQGNGEYVCFLDSDDLMLPHRFRTGVPILDRDQGVDGVYEWTATEFLEGGEARRGTVRPVVTFDCADPSLVLDTILARGQHWSTDAILLRRRSFVRVGGFSEDQRLRGFEDLVLWLKLAGVARLVRGSEDPVAVYRLHGRNISSADTLTQLTRPYLAYVEAFLWLRRQGAAPAARRVREALLGKLFYLCGACRSARVPGVALAHLLRAVPHHPRLLGMRRFWGNVAYAGAEGIGLRRGT
jgi:hypothetical protein